MSTIIQFLGGTETVTGSKYLIHADGKNILVDCGLFQGLKNLRLRNWRPFPVDLSSLHAIILTHAHIDHTGYLPVLYKNGYRNPVYATEPTRALCSVLLPDSGHLEEEDAAFANREGFSRHAPALPLYTESDARESLSIFQDVPYEKKISLSDNLSFELSPAGHILGAAIVRVHHNGRYITFTGDLGRSGNHFLTKPARIPSTDYLIIESTYGNRLHPDEDPHDTVERIINRALKRSGSILIPAFAVGRTQTMIRILYSLKANGRIPNIPVYLDSPMAIEATDLFCKYASFHDLPAKECRKIIETVHLSRTAEDSKRLAELEGSHIIISASGMATGGRVVHHLKRMLPHPENTILFSGFQAAGTRGEALIHGSKEVKIHGEWIPVRATVEKIESLSAHADSDGLIAWMKAMDQPPQRVFVTHGEPISSDTLRRRISHELGWRVAIPEYQEIFELK
jgi:metallo-beta-lactamase family protein